MIDGVELVAFIIEVIEEETMGEVMGTMDGMLVAELLVVDELETDELADALTNGWTLRCLSEGVYEVVICRSNSLDEPIL